MATFIIWSLVEGVTFEIATGENDCKQSLTCEMDIP